MSRRLEQRAAHTLVGRYQGLVCDLDGVVYRGRRAVTGSVQTLSDAMVRGMRVAFATNNASREPGEVLAHLEGLGLSSLPTAGTPSMTVVTSAEAAAHLVLGLVGSGEPVLAVGGPGVAAALRAAELVPFCTADARSFPVARAVVQGAGRDVDWSDLAEAAHRIQHGALWVSTNGDRTIPTSRGLAPGNGALADAVRAAVAIEPLVAGKPEPALYQLALERLAARPEDVLVVGDRLDTDIAGAARLGLDSMFVLGGVHRLAHVVHCEPVLRPTYVGVDLRAVRIEHDRGSRAQQREWIAVDHDQLVAPVLHQVEPSRRLDRVIRAAWAILDDGGDLPDHVDAWSELESQVVRDWIRWWTARERLPARDVPDDPKSARQVTSATPTPHPGR